MSMKLKLILIIALFCYSCSDSKAEVLEFDNSVCLEFVNQSGYPIEICDCVKEKVMKINQFTEVTYEDIELLVDECVQSNLSLGF